MKLIKLFALTAALLIFGQSVRAQSEYIILVKPMDSREWGFVNLKGEYVIQPKYRKVGEFSEDGYAPVYEDRKYHFINTKGEKLTTEISDYKLKNFFGFGMRGYENGMAPIDVDGKWGYMNEQGKLVIKPQYDDVNEFKKGYATAEKEGKWYVIDKQGTAIPVKAQNVKNIRPFYEGLAIFDNEERKFGYINTKGEVVIKPQFEKVGEFVNGLAWARKGEKTGFINTNGEWAINPQYDATHNFDTKSGMALVKQGDSWKYIDKSGTAMSIKLERYDDFHDGVAMARKDELIGFIDKSGNWVIEPRYDAARDFHNGYAAVRKGDKWGLINDKGVWVIEPTYDGIRDVVAIK